MGELVLGIDTSNYRTSVALVNELGEILYNHRELLEVPEGKKGLRQSEAFFQHVMRLPGGSGSGIQGQHHSRILLIETKAQRGELYALLHGRRDPGPGAFGGSECSS